MSNDSGADYCHPDLFGTWAYIDDPASPYDGLPEMFDSSRASSPPTTSTSARRSSSEGVADYADTSTKVTFRPNQPGTRQANFKPLGAKSQKTFKLPSTSRSGVYHIGSHPDNSLASVADIISKAFFKGAAKAQAGERAGVLVVDEHAAGVYDTVYVDLNYDYDFRNDAPARLARDFSSREAACLDYDQDGLNDISGGLVYFVSDRQHSVPTQDWLWGIPGSAYGNGDLVAFHVQDFLEGSDHGMGTTSVATGQGVVAGNVFFGPDGPPVAGGRGLVVGPGKDVRSSQNGNFYISPFLEDRSSSPPRLRRRPRHGRRHPDRQQLVGFLERSTTTGSIDSRILDAIHVALGPNTTVIVRDRQRRPGLRHRYAPKPATGIAVGAADLNDSVGAFFPDILESQIVGGDVTAFSDRGPTARNVTGTDVTAIGAFGTGDISLNETLWGAVATAQFSGTSMATPSPPATSR